MQDQNTAIDRKWVFKARQTQMLRQVIAGEGGTVGKLSKAAGCSTAYAHDLLAALVERGDVVKVEERSKRYGTIYRYYSEFYYVTAIRDLPPFIPDPNSRVDEMIIAFMERDCSAAEWYGFQSVGVEVVKQEIMF